MNWHWHNCTQVTLARLYPSDKNTIIPKWTCHDFSQVTLAPLFSSDTGTTFHKWQWHDCSQVTLIRLFPRENNTIVPKWQWDDLSQVTLAWLFPSDTDTIVFKWILTFKFVFCFAVCSLAWFFASKFHLGGIVPCTGVMAHDPIFFYYNLSLWCLIKQCFKFNIWSSVIL